MMVGVDHGGESPDHAGVQHAVLARVQAGGDVDASGDRRLQHLEEPIAPVGVQLEEAIRVA